MRFIFDTFAIALLVGLLLTACNDGTADTSDADGDTSDGDTSDGDTLDGDATDGDTTDGDTTQCPPGFYWNPALQKCDPIADGDVSDGDASDGDIEDGDIEDGDITDGDETDGDVSDGDVTDGDVTDGDVEDGDVSDGDITDGDIEEDGLLVEFHLLDIWGLPLDDGSFSLVGGDDALSAHTNEFDEVVELQLVAPDVYYATISEDGFYDAELTLDYSGGEDEDSLHVAGNFNDSPTSGLSISTEIRNTEQGERLVFSIYVGLRHKFFSAWGRPARKGNQLDLLMDGEETWASVYDDLKLATDNILVSTWWWESDFELIRDWYTHPYLTEAERQQNTIFQILSDSPATKRVAVGQFWGQDSMLEWMTRDAPLKEVAETPNDDFQFMGQANPSEGIFWVEYPPFYYRDRVMENSSDAQHADFLAEERIQPEIPPHQVDMTDFPVDVELTHASYHQKFMVIDDAVSYVGGMNLRRVDWDSSDHLVYDHRRMLFDATVDAREAVMAKESEPDNGPRKDYVMRIEGPSAQDVADVFSTRWDYLIDEGVDYSENSTPFDVNRNITAQPDGVWAQITTTLPEPFNEMSIYESWINAVNQAEELIYIEDQYFRAPILNEAIYQRMVEKPELKLIVITMPINEWTDLGCRWSYESNALFQNAFPGRFALYQLRAFDSVVTWGFDETESRFVDMDVHSKMFIVDDVFMSIGSCNKNNRGMLYEGEMNVSVYDQEFVRSERRRIISNLLDRDPGTDDPWRLWNEISSAAQANDAVYDRWDEEGWDIDNGDIDEHNPLPAEYQPIGFLYTLIFRDVDQCFFEDVGPDVMR